VGLGGGPREPERVAVGRSGRSCVVAWTGSWSTEPRESLFQGSAQSYFYAATVCRTADADGDEEAGLTAVDTAAALAGWQPGTPCTGVPKHDTCIIHVHFIFSERNAITPAATAGLLGREEEHDPFLLSILPRNMGYVRYLLHCGPDTVIRHSSQSWPVHSSWASDCLQHGP